MSSEPNVLVSFRLDRERPLRVRWLASDGVPGDGYKAQVTAIVLADGTRLAMHGTSIIEQSQPDAAGGKGAYLVTFNGVVGYGASHEHRGVVEKLGEAEVDYEVEFTRDDGAGAAVPDQDFKIVDKPRAMARTMSHRDA